MPQPGDIVMAQDLEPRQPGRPAALTPSWSLKSARFIKGIRRHGINHERLSYLNVKVKWDRVVSI